MADPRVHILFRFRDGPWGGCNQFLTALREGLRARGCWVDTPDQADVILFDSFNEASEVIRWKRLLPGTAFVQRIDGPISIYRDRDRHLDRLIHAFGEALADGMVFQSDFSRQANLDLGLRGPARWAVILNAPSPQFSPGAPMPAAPRKRLIAVSWSPNWNKGFDVYRYLDRNLDHARYDFTFVGNSPVRFEHARQLPPQDTAALIALLREQDIYITASQNDPCSNALAEALACGLPAVALASGGHPELLGGGGATFTGTADVIAAIDRVAADRDLFTAAIPRRSIQDVTDEYLEFLRAVAAAAPRRRLSLPAMVKLRFWQAMRLAGLARDKLLRTLGA